MRRIFNLTLIALILIGSLSLSFGKSQAAGSVSGADMIAMMNGWRASFWPNALIEDPSLSACAQWTAEEMERIDAGDHLAYLGYADATARCPGHGFVTENWCENPNMTIGELSNCWDDYDHMLPATKQQYTTVGVGISGKYYILQAGTIMGDGSVPPTPGSAISDPGGSPEPISNYVVAVSTSTPDYDGNISHVVKSGETLYTIAVNYNVTIEQIKLLNQMTTNDIYPGNVLKISLKPTPTITLTRTPTVMMPSRTPTQTPMPTTPRPTGTVTPTPIPSPNSLLPRIDRQWLGLSLLVLSAAGFFVVFYFLFLRKPKSKE